MPSSIAYDHPSLVLGTVVDTQLLDSLDQVADLQQIIDAAQEKMNSLLMMRRSFAMTLNELLDMNVDVSDLKAEIQKLDTQISKAAAEYMNVRLKNETDIQQVKGKLSQLKINTHTESPLDFSKSQLTSQPLAYESMKLDAQYFSFGSNLESDTLANIESYVKSANADLGKGANEVAKEATSKIQEQHENHSIAGTLVITACCMHKHVSMFDPFVLDVNKAIATWNSTLGKDDMIDTSNPSALATASQNPSANPSKNSLSILSGAAYGSSFVGMVHVLNTEASSPAEDRIASLNEKLKLGGWLENAAGGFGVDGETMSEVKKMLSTQQVSSHVSLVTMGAIPTISSTQIDMGVKQIMKPDQEAINQMMQVDTNGSENVQRGSDMSREGNQLLSIQKAKIQSVMQGLEKIDQGSNQVMDINSLMSAFDNYLQVISKDNDITGSPIRFYTKKITKNQLIKQWLKKYYSETSTENSSKSKSTEQ